MRLIKAVTGKALAVTHISQDKEMVGLFFFKDFIYLFLQMGEGKEGGTHQCVRETSNSCFLHSPQPGIEPETQACTLTRN